MTAADIPGTRSAGRDLLANGLEDLARILRARGQRDEADRLEDKAWRKRWAVLEAEALAAGADDPIAALEWRRLTPAERAQVVRDAAAFRVAHDRQVAALGPYARAAHEAACVRCEEEAA